MELKKYGWVAFVNYGLWKKRVPESISLCKLFWRTIIMAAGSGLFLVFGSIILALVFSVSALFALRPNILEGDPETNGALIPYSRWPAIKGFLIRPIYFVYPPVLWWSIKAFSHNELAWWIVTLSAALLIIVLGKLVLDGIKAVADYVRYRDRKKRETPEFVKVAREWVKAKKQKVCPKVEFK